MACNLAFILAFSIKYLKPLFLYSFQFGRHVLAVANNIDVFVHFATGAIELDKLHHPVVRVEDLVPQAAVEFVRILL